MFMVAAPKVVTIIQARLGSTRFPRKVLADIGGTMMLRRVIDRARLIGYPVCVAIPREDKFPWAEIDNSLPSEVFSQGFWTFWQGSENDVLERYSEAACAMKADHVIRVTSDCPFLDVEAARWTVDHHLQTGADFTHYIAEGR